MAGGFVNEMDVFLQIWKLSVLENSQFAIELVAREAGTMSHQIMNAAVNQVVDVLPTFGDAAGFMMMLENGRTITVHAGVGAGRKTGKARADDNDGFFRHA